MTETPEDLDAQIRQRMAEVTQALRDRSGQGGSWREQAAERLEALTDPALEDVPLIERAAKAWWRDDPLDTGF